MGALGSPEGRTDGVAAEYKPVTETPGDVAVTADARAMNEYETPFVRPEISHRSGWVSSGNAPEAVHRFVESPTAVTS